MVRRICKVTFLNGLNISKLQKTSRKQNNKFSTFKNPNRAFLKEIKTLLKFTFQ